MREKALIIPARQQTEQSVGMRLGSLAARCHLDAPIGHGRMVAAPDLADVRSRLFWTSRLRKSSGRAVGKTIVSSGIIDRVTAKLGGKLVEVPVGFKWFVDGLIDGSFGFAGEESAGASFLRHNGTVWTTDKDGLIPGLLAAEITARTGCDPGETFDNLTRELGVPFYERIDAPATAEQRALLKAVSPEQIGMKDLAGEPIRAKLTIAPGNGAAFGGIKVIAANGWFAARLFGTEDVYKIYVESFRSEDHLRQIQQVAQDAIADLFKAEKPA